MAIHIPEESKLLFAALNGVHFPERLTAIYHRDDRNLEVIWTAYKLSEESKEIADRKFVFNLGVTSVECEFGRSSDVFLEIAKHCVPVSSASNTNFRNVLSFNRYTYGQEAGHTSTGVNEPVSFWIKGLDFDEDKVINLLRNLNFHLLYHDARSPIINIHDPSEIDEQGIQKVRYLFDEFPNVISSNPIDDNLLSFWEGASRSDEMLKFIFYYRIVEYAAMSHASEKLKSKFRRIIKKPSIHHDYERTLEEILNVHNSVQSNDEISRIKSILSHVVDLKLVWKEIEKNKVFFSEAHVFDGGFELKPLVSAECKYQNFESNGIISIADQARKIRNALSHGKDISADGVIRPTTRNVKLLMAWVHIMSIVASEMISQKGEA